MIVSSNTSRGFRYAGYRGYRGFGRGGPGSNAQLLDSGGLTLDPNVVPIAVQAKAAASGSLPDSSSTTNSGDSAGSSSGGGFWSSLGTSLLKSITSVTDPSVTPYPPLPPPMLQRPKPISPWVWVASGLGVLLVGGVIVKAVSR